MAVLLCRYTSLVILDKRGRFSAPQPSKLGGKPSPYLINLYKEPIMYLYGANTQTCKLSHKANSLNYALAHMQPNSTVLGFKVVQGNLEHYMSHVHLDGHCFTLCIAEESTEVKRWESSEGKEAEQKLIDEGYVWLVCLCGSDDHTGYTRFKTLEDAKQWFVSDEVINYDSDKYWTVN